MQIFLGGDAHTVCVCAFSLFSRAKCETVTIPIWFFNFAVTTTSIGAWMWSVAASSRQVYKSTLWSMHERWTSATDFRFGNLFEVQVATHALRLLLCRLSRENFGCKTNLAGISVMTQVEAMAHTINNNDNLSPVHAINSAKRFKYWNYGNAYEHDTQIG